MFYVIVNLDRSEFGVDLDFVAFVVPGWFENCEGLLAPVETSIKSVDWFGFGTNGNTLLSYSK